MLSRDSESRRRKKESDRDSPRFKDSEEEKDKDKAKDRERRDRHKTSSRSSRSKTSTSSKDPIRDADVRHHRHKKSSSHHSHSSRKMSVVPEMDRRPPDSPGASKTSLPYPSFSKAHSREAVGSKDSLPAPKAAVYTPDPTDLGHTSRDKPTSGERRAATAPPSPPLTATAASEQRRSESRQSTRRSAERTMEEASKSRRSTESPSRTSTGPKFSTSRSSLRESTLADNVSDVTRDTEYSMRSSSLETPKKAAPSIRPLSPNAHPPGRSASIGSHNIPSVAQSTTDSDATSIAPDRKPARRTASVLCRNDAPPISAVTSTPYTPNVRHTPIPTVTPDSREPTPIEVFADDTDETPGKTASNPYVQQPAPPPPPPPPPPAPVFDHPRVDYLLQNGGLSHLVSRNLLSAAVGKKPVAPYQQYASPRPSDNHAINVQAFFAPLENLLNDYTKVMEKNGSLAVATGYRSVARRLLDRLEAVFSRNISEERCQCIMCHSSAFAPPQTDLERGVSWGEILEYVSGRRELPPWPPFSLAPTSTGLGLQGHEAPMQKVDIDVPEEYREHYIRQSKKTKQAVQSWLTAQPEDPPPEVDDATLAFAIMTKLEEEKRPVFSALLRGQLTIPVSRSQTPLENHQPELLKHTSHALQRLYRLPTLPRNPECAIFLLKHAELHPVLATLAAVSSGEWEILISGRFDGFLWSGADNGVGTPLSRAPSRGPTATPLSRNVTPFSPGVSRGPTPFSPGPSGRISRGPTPAPSSFGAPVQMDEETEIAVLAEVEREIYVGMEALEDAFESLHMKAEAVRNALRERSAGLSMAAQARRGSMAEDVEVRLGTPASMYGMDRWDEETDDGIDDERSELAPDDSASNISYNRHRRRGQRERKTPAPVAEEDETVFSEDFRGER
ncbi:hypothetical protein EJ05DRAFT_475439 [Pseudovirgaria hyperparasitica]|uniref:5-Methylcytosine G/T mismatch-specific DNA glycosylase n=1 Tax=Pseudovirgaria hyperparasitica TaxID=470096 RepID=A0A6A6WCC6_9PEZI|nr:uncharacterized protein EJ05DRAFT_475439 [Pseudovirgaria hyperparasitica]KAF2759217.1 hypothetical protein EJ05DRAFT_475439 [Pseudovirgaria hyperparasitica]